jgi:hypothetical protein
MITYNWTISAVECKVKENNLEKVIQTIHWRYNGTNEDGVSHEMYGAEVLPEPDPNSFLDFNNVTESVAIEWLESIFSEITDNEEVSRLDSMKSKIAEAIELAINPVIVTLPLRKDNVQEEPETEEEDNSEPEQ